MRTKQWIRLDNAAKIFPAAAYGSDTQVFRLSCELTEPVNAHILQQALNETAAMFPVYQCVMRRGLFWYYLDSTDLKPVVREEYKPPCSAIYCKSNKGLLYEVTYFKNRVNLEMFHVIADGKGAAVFLTALITKYLTLAHGVSAPSLFINASHTQMSNDSFATYYDDKNHSKAVPRPNSYKIKGAKVAENRLKLITGHVPVDQVLRIAKGYGATITVFLCACLIKAIGSNMSVRAKRKPVVIAIPVNLRSFFPSLTARNFFGLVHVEYDFSTESGTLEDIIQKIGKQLKEGLEPERLYSDLNRFSALEHNVFARIVPLPVKNIVMRTAYLLSRRKVTAALSNIGIINVSFGTDYIRSFDVCSATDSMQVCVCSFENCLSISFTSRFISADIQQYFFRMLVQMGIAVEISSNNVENE
ncbi:MAG: hypothetical protein GX066_04780 [Clostridiaceae bacterium]|nr:hypothetical protein [Clostridiaceae bacterium]